ncbi:MAG TPA: acetate kinase [Clostridiales bacterium]|nr:acetate kinase [Clostridiales bacterium]
MKQYILSLNSGSSSLKFNLFELNEHSVLFSYISGIVEEVGNNDRSMLKYSFDGIKQKHQVAVASHKEALELIFSELKKNNISLESIIGVGHRVVHGGDKYIHSVLIDDEVIDSIRELIPLAPLHNAPNLTGIQEAVKLLPNVPHVAVFDTAFHGRMPEHAFRYAIPDEWYQNYKVRRYGFHGTSHLYVAKRAARFLGIPFNQFNGITVHLGNGCSITKIQNGKSVDTSMGFTPLEGLVMGTRTGDIDPAIISYVADKLADDKGLPKIEAYQSVMRALNKEGGLKALAGVSMMQDIRQGAIEGDSKAQTALSVYAYRVAKYIGAYFATLSKPHAIVFTAGIGENEGYVRARILSFLENLPFHIKEENNMAKQEMEIAKCTLADGSNLSVLVIPTDEEIVIGYDTLFVGCLKQGVPEEYPFER